MRKFILFSLSAFLYCSTTISFAQNAIHFDGSNDIVQTTFAGVTGSNNRTFEAWIKVDVGAASSNLCIMDYGLNAVGSRNTFSVSGNRGLSFISGGTNANMGSSSSGIVTEGQWMHVAFVLDNGTGYVYLNGTQVGTGNLSTVNTPATGTDLRIGERISGGSIPFEGVIDEVRIWNVARTASEIANNRNTEFCTVPPGLVAYYTFNQGIASGNNSGLTNLHNAVLNANGTLTNFSLSGSTSNWVSGASITPGLTVSKNNLNVCDSMVSPSGLYTWTSTGVYYDTVSNANTCDSIMRFSLTVNNSVYDVVNDTVCEPYTSPSGNYTYTSSGTYYDTTLTSKGCSHVYELNLDITVIDTSVTLATTTLTSNEANATYAWLDCNNAYTAIPSETSQSFNVTTNGNYAVRVEKNGCIDTSACTEITWVGINDRSTTILDIYPNPSNGVLFIEGSFAGKLSIIDSKGVIAFETMIESNSIESISLPSSLANGMYLVQLQNDQVFVRKKLYILLER